MKRNIIRRQFLQAAGVAAVGGGLAVARPSWLGAAEPEKGTPHAEEIGWRVGCQAWSFNRYTFFEAVDRTASLGLKWIEAYPGQKISHKHGDAEMGDKMTAGERGDVKKKLSDSGVTVVNFGVCPLTRNAAASRKTFEWAKEMGIETLVSEPSEDAMETLDQLAGEFEMNVAIHNHPKPSHYWNPDTVLKAVEGRSKRIGACADTGHWVRSGLDAVECLTKLENRIISLHFKDLNAKASDAHDVPWGTGVANAQAMLAELYRQKFKGVFSIEYEYNWTSSLPDMAQCAAFIDQMAGELAAKG